MSERDRRVERIRHQNELLSNPDFAKRVRAAQLHDAKRVGLLALGLFLATGLLYALTNWV